MYEQSKMSRLLDEYCNATGSNEVDIDDVYRWAVDNGMWHPKPQSVEKLFKQELSSSLRQEKAVDGSGREHRKYLAVTESVGDRQLSLWCHIDHASPSFVERSLKQRRDKIVRGAFKIKMDADHYNEYGGTNTQISFDFDLNEDVAECEALDQMSRKKRG